MQTVAIIQARMGSARFPGKVLADVGGKPLLWYVVQRVRRAQRVDHLVVATPLTDADHEIVGYAQGMCGVRDVVMHRDEQDVLTRFVKAAQPCLDGLPTPDIIVRLTADCPLVPPEAIDRAVEAVQGGHWDYATNAHPSSGYRDGEDVEVFTREVLEALDIETTYAAGREHVTSRLRATGMGFRCGLLQRKGDVVPLPLGQHTSEWSGERLSVNTPEDLARIAPLLLEEAR